jgi:riboflavin biosynthesis pyrimidine reductase
VRRFSVTSLAPLVTLLEPEEGTEIPLPAPLATVYGRLWLGSAGNSPYLLCNFASSLDGVVSLDPKGRSGGGEITGFNLHDRMVMGILRSVAGAVIVGAGTLRSVPRHLWTASHIYPELAPSYAELRRSLGLPAEPLNVIVSARGDLDLSLPVFTSKEVRALVVTTRAGAQRIASHPRAGSVQVREVPGEDHVEAAAVLRAVHSTEPAPFLLLEGGPTLLGEFLAEHLVNELFLTIASQVAGRSPSHDRPGLVAGRSFAPEAPLWGSLTGIKRAGDLLLLRYRFDGHEAKSTSNHPPGSA